MTRDEIADASKASGGMFAVIPAIVMRDTELSMSARMLYGILTWKCNDESRCWPTNRTLGEELGISPKRVSVLISQLEARGHIETELVYDKETGQVMRRYIYPLMKSGRGIPKNEDTPPHEQGYPIPQNEEEKRKEETKRDIPPKAPQGGQRQKEPKKVPDWKPERFVRFWDFYSHHARGENKQAAIRAWDKLRPDDGLIEAMGRALMQQIASEAWRQGIGIPYASTWLNNSRWEDTPKAAAPAASTGAWADDPEVI